MPKFTSFCVMTAVALCFSLSVTAAEPKLKCPVSGKECGKDHAAAYKDGKVYFCCDKCPKAFEATPEKYAVKANQQLAQTGQYKEVKCPLTGKALNDEAVAKIGGMEIKFCCNGCAGKVKKSRGAARTKLVFSDEAFKKGFVKAEK